jgi:hypothetical protein
MLLREADHGCPLAVALAALRPAVAAATASVTEARVRSRGFFRYADSAELLPGKRGFLRYADSAESLWRKRGFFRYADSADLL